MAITLEECEHKVKQLTLKDRATLIEHLISSLDDLDEVECERLWVQEAEKRYQGYKAGRIKSRPAENVFSDAKARLGKIK
jgi:putative addiction module component (TIGR02574 family)